MLTWLVSAAFLGQAQAPPLAPDIESLARAATVLVKNRTQETKANGIVVAQSQTVCYVLTVAHVFEKGDILQVDIFLPGDGGKKLSINDVKIIEQSDPFAQDLAVLSVRTGKAGVEFAKLRLAPEQSIAKPPFAAFSMSWEEPEGAESRAEKITEDKLLSKTNDGKKCRFWKSVAVPEAGRSGGPLLDAEGRLLGICSGNDKKNGYYTHVVEIRRFFDSKVVLKVLDIEGKTKAPAAAK